MKPPKGPSAQQAETILKAIIALSPQVGKEMLRPLLPDSCWLRPLPRPWYAQVH